MYYKIIPPQKDEYTDIGMVNVLAAFYLEKGDEGYDKYMAEHHVTVPVFPPEGYPRQKELDEQGEEWDAYREQQRLISTFPTEVRIEDGEEIIYPILPEGFVELVNPILKEYVLYNKWVSELPTEERDNPFCNHFIQFEADVIKEEILYCFEFALAQTRLNYLEDDLHCEKGTSAKRINQDIGYLQRLADYRQPTTEMKLKISAAEAKTAELKNVDFTKVKTIAKYSVK